MSMAKDRSTWWRRVGSKEYGFTYTDANDKRLRVRNVMARIKTLVIPPAWTDVLISPIAASKVQAVGKDSIGRTQYIYNTAYVEQRQTKKFAKLIAFAEKLPLLRKRTKKDIKAESFSKSRVLAVIIQLINDLYFRVGSEKSVKQYKTFGVTTLRKRHVEIEPNKIIFNFVGKHSIRHKRIVTDRKLASAMKDIMSIGGSKLFNYLDDSGQVRPITARDVNEYIKQSTDPKFTAKDFRTWGATLKAATELSEIGITKGERSIKKNIIRAIRSVAEHLGNTVAVCRSSYVHPDVLKKYEKGVTLENFRKKAQRFMKRLRGELDTEEAALLHLLKS